MSFSSCLIVMAGGAIGTLGRYVVSALALPISRDLPWGTIIINITGSFVIGLFGTLTLASGRLPASENMRLFVMIGLCGGYTTFSSFSLQTLELLRSGAVVRAAVNVAGSVVLCVLAVAAGHYLAAHFNKPPGGGHSGAAGLLAPHHCRETRRRPVHVGHTPGTVGSRDRSPGRRQPADGEHMAQEDHTR